jgi:hemerythrin
MVLAWTSDLDTGIDVIDNQHKRIVDYINQLGVAIQQQNRISVGAVLDELVGYTVSHFAFEESLQEEAGYELAKPHKGVHEMFIKRIAKYQARHSAGEDIAKELHGMLSTWLIHHIKRDDMAYVSEVKDNILGIISDREKKNDGGWFKRFFK